MIWASIIGLVLLALLVQLAASGNWPTCGFKCQANDVNMSHFWLGDDRGNDLIPGEIGEKIPCVLWAQFSNNANSPRYAPVLLADLYLNGTLSQSFYDQGLCILDTIKPKSTVDLPVCHLIWTRGEEIMLNRLVLSWETDKGASCTQSDRKCGSRSTKCYGGKEMGYFIETPFSVAFTFSFQGSSPCVVNFFDHIAGGLEPYVVDWDFGDGSHSKEADPVHIYNIPGNYTVRLQAYDQSKKIFSVSRVLRVMTCSCTIIGQDHACISKTETYRASLTGNYSRTYKWKLDGIEVSASDGENIDINWQEFGLGQHDLQVLIFDPESSMQLCECNMLIHVLPEPKAIISIIGMLCQIVS